MKTRNAAAQVALRTAAPAIAVHALLQGEEKRINRLDQLVRDRATKIDARDAKLEAQNHHLAAKVTTLERNEASAQRAAEIEKATLQERVHALEEEKKRLLAELAAVPAAPAQPEPRALRTKKRRAAPRKPASTKRAKRPPKKPGR
jgi:predicted  nucleic acid-binding Zn-ribbon protein